MYQIFALFACVSTCGLGWRVQRSVAQMDREYEASVTSSPKVSKNDRPFILAMMQLARQPSVELHRASRQRFVNLRKLLSTLPQGRVNPNFARMNIEEGENNDLFEAGGDEDEQVMVEVGPDAESSEDIDWPSDAKSEEVFAQDDVANADDKNERERLKLSVLKMGASYNRGFGASPSVRKLMSNMITDLESRNSTKDAARGVSGDDLQGTPPLQGTWRMIWTSSQDSYMNLIRTVVEKFMPSPTVGAVYEIHDPPVSRSITEFIPGQNLQPWSVGKLESTHRTSPQLNSPNRVVTSCESWKLKFAGFELKVPMHTLPPSYFDVAYLDDDMRIERRKNGNFCVTIRVDSYEP